MTGIWINNDWYIPVDDTGYVEGPCFEGMLGCVMQLRSGKGDAHLAMKIPRLLADTIEENAYICSLTEDEMDAVRRINADGGTVEGLLPAQYVQDNVLIKRRATGNSDHPEARAQDNHVVFVSFEQDKKPRFCAVNLTDNALQVFPPGCREDFIADVDLGDWSEFASLTGSEQHLAFSKPIFRTREAKETSQSGQLMYALRGRQTRTWYAGIPSILFTWAKGNLQETITRTEIGQWSPTQHFRLFEQILRGLRFLHAKGMIHGDIRPANIMWIGSSPDPGNYRLGDYGSYGHEWQALGKPSKGGLTLIGPAIGQRRQTAFYSPERRAGNEFESADTAIVSSVEIDRQTGDYRYVVLLGWRSALLNNGVPKPEVIETMLDWATDPHETSRVSSHELRQGDRLRLRNYLFEVIRSEHQGNNQTLFLCTGRYADILHDRLVVYKQSGSIKDGTVIDLSNYVEFHQWAAASDLFSFGAVCLYSLFCSGLQNHKPKDSTTNPSLDNPDRLFVEMIEILESVPYFEFFWKELEAVRQVIERLFNEDPQPTPEQAAAKKVSEDQTLFQMALYATNNIIQSTPKARLLLEAFNFNLAHFLLFMHFVLACLHRRSHMSTETTTNGGANNIFTPFAEDRVEPPQENGAAVRALERLLTISQYLEQPFFRNFRCDNKSEILEFDPRSDFQIRIEDSTRKEELEKLTKLRLWPLLSLHPALRKLVFRIIKTGNKNGDGN